MHSRRVVLVLGVLAAASAHAAPTAPQPIASSATTAVGVDAEAAYRIDIPAQWNRGLVVFFHGYETAPKAYAKDEPIGPMLAQVLQRGYAVIQSGYAKPGWAVEEGSADSERLRRRFVAEHGKSGPTYAMGMSMGGTLTVMAIESHPAIYDGALSLCGAIEPTDRMMQRDFAMRAAFDYYFPGVFGALVPIPDAYEPGAEVAAKIAAAMQANPQGAAAFRALYGASDPHSLPDVIASTTYDLKEMQQRTHGNPFGNADLVYTGSGDDFALNDGVRRYRAEARAAAYVSRWYTPSGKLLKPLLALHDSGDPLVVASTAFDYALAVQRASRADNFVQQYVNAEGHCVFTPEQVGHAFDELVAWTREGRRPESGRLRP